MCTTCARRQACTLALPLWPPGRKQSVRRETTTPINHHRPSALFFCVTLIAHSTLDPLHVLLPGRRPAASSLAAVSGRHMHAPSSSPLFIPRPLAHSTTPFEKKQRSRRHVNTVCCLHKELSLSLSRSVAVCVCVSLSQALKSKQSRGRGAGGRAAAAAQKKRARRASAPLPLSTAEQENLEDW